LLGGLSLEEAGIVLTEREPKETSTRRTAGRVELVARTSASVQSEGGVRFVNSDHQPQILGVSTNPPASGSAKLVTLTGSGTLGVKVKAFGADEVRVLLVPSGTQSSARRRTSGLAPSTGSCRRLGARFSVSEFCRSAE
jgi:hypothetical protein